MFFFFQKTQFSHRDHASYLAHVIVLRKKSETPSNNSGIEQVWWFIAASLQSAVMVLKTKTHLENSSTADLSHKWRLIRIQFDIYKN